MNNLFRSVLIVIFLIATQLALYLVLVGPHVAAWGATDEEVVMPMAGDHISPHIASTRAIDIDAPKSETWRWLMQLGADRGGFFSYYFIEKALGYISREPGSVDAEYEDFEVGDLVRGSLDESKSIVPYNFPVLSIKTEESLVLDHWGTFKVVGLSDSQSRLIVRSHTPEQTNVLLRLVDICLGVPLHFVMERRTLLGLKARVEAGEGPAFSATQDKIWFFGIVLSVLGLLVLVFVSRGLSSIVLPFVLSSLWIVTLYILKPIPIYSLSVAFIIISTIVYTLYASYFKIRNKN